MTTNEVDLVVKVAGEKAGGTDGQLVMEDVELGQSRDNRIRHGIGNEQPQAIERGNRTYTFDTTVHLNAAGKRMLRAIDNGNAEDQTVYIRENDQTIGTAGGMVFNDLPLSASDDGDTTVEVSADLLDVKYE